MSNYTIGFKFEFVFFDQLQSGYIKETKQQDGKTVYFCQWDNGGGGSWYFAEQIDEQLERAEKWKAGTLW